MTPCRADISRCSYQSSGLLTALGVVHGDIGTSPLCVYAALKQAAGRIDTMAAVGRMSLVILTLIVIVSV